MKHEFEQLDISKTESGETVVTAIDKQTGKLTWFIDPCIEEERIVAAYQIFTEDNIRMPKGE